MINIVNYYIMINKIYLCNYDNNKLHMNDNKLKIKNNYIKKYQKKYLHNKNKQQIKTLLDNTYKDEFFSHPTLPTIINHSI